MLYVFLALLIISSVILGLIVLIQNPKGGGLAGNIGGFSNQLMGVKQTTDVLEKGTWIFGGIIAVLCLTWSLFIGSGSTSSSGPLDGVGAAPAGGTQQQQSPVLPGQTPVNTVPVQVNPDSVPK